jgi:UDP-glucuronate 4-epimerase
MISLLEKYLNTKAIINKLPMQAGDVRITYADISKARNLLKYDPVWSFEDGIQSFLNSMDIDWQDVNK